MKPTNCLPELQARGLVSRMTDELGLAKRMAEQDVKPYCGFDPTANSLHVGSLVPLLLLQRLQRSGHSPIALVGGATGMIGDPSGKSAERKLASRDDVQACADSLRRQIERFLAFDGPCAARMVDNHDWFGPMGMLDFLRDVGKLVTVNTLLGRDAVKTRIDRPEAGISFTEFSYGLLQGYDFAQLNRTLGCSLQVGGSDQWGNIVLGLDITRKLTTNEVYGLTTPLVTKADGGKFGKSEAGNVWLSANKTSPYAFYQFWLNAADADVRTFLSYFTYLPLRDIEDLLDADRQNPGRPQAQRVLAEQVTQLVHGALAVQSAQRISAALFTRELDALTEGDFAQLAQDGLTTVRLLAGESTTLTDLLVRCGLTASKSQGKQLLQQGAIAVNGVATRDDDVLDPSRARFCRYQLLQRGPRTHALVEWQEVGR